MVAPERAYNRPVAEWTLERARPEDLDEALELLEQCDLPREGVAESFGHFLVAREALRLVGLVGLESCGPDALLRSLVVAASHRGRGLGLELLRQALELAPLTGAHDVYLLTSTARDFFLRHGFRDCPREQAPVAVRSSWEFRQGCPSTSAFMKRTASTSS